MLSNSQEATQPGSPRTGIQTRLGTPASPRVPLGPGGVMHRPGEPCVKELRFLTQGVQWEPWGRFPTPARFQDGLHRVLSRITGRDFWFKTHDRHTTRTWRDAEKPRGQRCSGKSQALSRPRTGPRGAPEAVRRVKAGARSQDAVGDPRLPDSIRPGSPSVLGEQQAARPVRRAAQRASAGPSAQAACAAPQQRVGVRQGGHWTPRPSACLGGLLPPADPSGTVRPRLATGGGRGHALPGARVM